ncbi:Phosphoribosylformylglycinamidine (FGAM) synthase, synthetase domain [Streptococcus suis 98HAH33]|nr:Phosphoribosylformylglycinamidine (FGAM) synthase, synthetase domain [Streptococcus suis 98HAH33]
MSMRLLSLSQQVNEWVFLNTAVQKMVTAKNYTVLLGQKMPFSKKSALLIIKYKAKLGIKSPVSIEHLSENRYKITLPAFEFIGLELNAKKPYTLYNKSGEILILATKKIDTAQLITDDFSR